MNESTSTNEWPVDSTSYTLPNGQTVIGRDAYEAEMVKAVFAEKAPEDGPIVDPAKVQLHDLAFARRARGDHDEFTHEFIGRLAYTTSLTPEGRKAWSDALKAMGS